MAHSVDLCFNVSTGRFVLSAALPLDVPSPLQWVYGDTEHIQLQFVKSADVPGRVTIVPSAGVGVQLAFGPITAPYNSATAGAASGDIFPVDLAMVGTQLTTDIAGKAYIDTLLEMKTTSGGVYKRYQVPLRIFNRVAVDALADPTPPDVAMTKSDALATFVKQDNAPGDFQIWRSPDGTVKARVYLGNDGTIHADAF